MASMEKKGEVIVVEVEKTPVDSEVPEVAKRCGRYAWAGVGFACLQGATWWARARRGGG